MESRRNGPQLSLRHDDDDDVCFVEVQQLLFRHIFLSCLRQLQQASVESRLSEGNPR